MVLQQKNQGRAVVSPDFDGFKMITELAPKPWYEPGTRQDSDHRRPEGYYSQEDHRGRERKYETIPDERMQEYGHSVQGEMRQSNRSHYEGKLD